MSFDEKMIEESLVAGDISVMLDRRYCVVEIEWEALNRKFTSEVLRRDGYFSLQYSEMRPQRNRAGFAPALLRNHAPIIGAGLVSFHGTAVVTANC